MNGWTARIFVSLVLLAIGPACASDAHLVLDINDSIIAVDSSPANFADQGSWSFFTATDGVNPAAPWSTDGTTATRLAAPDAMGITPLVSATYRAGTLTFYTMRIQNRGTSLWVTNGSAASTREVMPPEQEPKFVGVLGNELAYLHYDNTFAYQLWLTDGTAAGTRTISHFDSSTGNAQAGVIMNDRVFFLVRSSQFQNEPWVSDGTAAGTERLASLPQASGESRSNAPIARAGRYVVFSSATQDRGEELWSIDTQNGTVAPLPEIASGTDPGIDISLEEHTLTSVSEVVVFVGTPASGVQELWRTDGTPGGTRRLSRLVPDSFTQPALFRASDAAGPLIFAADKNGVPQLLGTDGTTVETLLSGSAVELLGRVGSLYYFSKYDNTTAWYELWRTDGTRSGTRRLSGFSSEPAQYEVTGNDTRLFVRQVLTNASGPNDPQARIFEYDLQADQARLLLSIARVPGGSLDKVFSFAQGKLYFDGASAATGHELWVWAGEPIGAREVRNIAPETQTKPSYPENFLDLNGRLVVTADDGVHGREWWISDGTASGTHLMIDLHPGEDGAQIKSPFVLNGKLYFFARSSSAGYALYQSDGTERGTVALATLEAPAVTPACGPIGFAVGDTIYFQATTAAEGQELWRTDGRAGGTERVTDIQPGAADSRICSPVYFSGRIFYQAEGGDPVRVRLWSVDTRTGAVEEQAGLFQNALTDAQPSVAWGGHLYLTAAIAGEGVQVWKSDGTAAGTVPLTRFDPKVSRGIGKVMLAGRHLVFQVRTDTAATEVWGSDGTAAGTVRVGYVYSLNESTDLAASGASAFFGGFTLAESENVEPWISDGTAKGTSQILDIAPAAGAYPFYFTDFSGITVFQVSASSPARRGIWRTDGTASGTMQLSTILPMQVITLPYEPLPPRQMASGQSFFFMGNDGHSGAELFAVTNKIPRCKTESAGHIESGQSVIVHVLDNDADPDGLLDSVSVAIETDPGHGRAEVNADGTITYSADANYVGSDSFSYSVADQQGARSAPTNVGIKILQATVPSPEPPVPPEPGKNGGGGGGGTWGLVELAGLLLLLNRRRLLDDRPLSKSQVHPGAR